MEGAAAGCCVWCAETLFCDIIPFRDSAVLCRVEGAAAGCCVWCAVTRALGSTTVSWPAMAAPASLKDPSGGVSYTGTKAVKREKQWFTKIHKKYRYFYGILHNFILFCIFEQLNSMGMYRKSKVASPKVEVPFRSDYRIGIAE